MNSLENIWRGYLLENPNDETITSFVVEEFFIPDNIGLKKFYNNFHVWNLSEGELMMNMFDLGRYGISPSMKKIVLEGQANTFPDWFICGYPDVVWHLINDIVDPTQITYFQGKIDFHDMDTFHIDRNGQRKFTLKVLRHFTDYYKSMIQGRLECKE